ncbi:hypothetical protein INR49_030867, partial [Caranx melampygus]
IPPTTITTPSSPNPTADITLGEGARGINCSYCSLGRGLCSDCGSTAWIHPKVILMVATTL